MAIPNGGGGYQIGAGNPSEAQLLVQSAPTDITGDVTLTGAQLATGLFVVDTGADATATLPTVALTEQAIPNAQKVGSAFDIWVCNKDASYQVTIAAGTGWTLVGNAVVLENTSATFRARKTADGAWSLYRIAG